MLLKLGGHISKCLERAASAKDRALQSQDSATRSDNELLAQSWRHLALSYKFVESLERFLSNKDSYKTIPPEIPGDVVEQLEASENKPIVRRPRVHRETSFKDRLLRSAQGAREQAARLPAGAPRDRLLQKARESETAANIDTWISSPGSPPPDGFGLGKKTGA
ncbi:hypothetical protein [Bradyrhizobium sp.]|jgi:hypothetical protein|uniref:hypothetical protein n=1 Tax=Bradyrhizobium sp. TaxID=376 RepID=UPI003C6F8C66